MNDDVPPVLELALELRPSMIRLFARDLLFVLWCAAAVVFSVVVAVQFADRLDVVAVCALGLGWSLWQGWRWVRLLRRKIRVLGSGVVTLRLDDLGVRVRSLFGNLDGADLAWTDCAAVVVSRAPASVDAPARVTRYVQFVAVDEDRIEGHTRASDLRPALLGIAPRQALMVWLELAGQLPGADEVVAWVRARRPGLRLVDSAGTAQSVREE